MSRSTRRARVHSAITSRLRRFLWRLVRALIVGAAALGPGTPPPPPPPPPPIEQHDDDGAEREAR
ncbi:MAG: hypothetical protein K0S65_592 [Labilithrix sp.]|nr:hypothetical protein [Labilithrix sp.]